MSGENIAVPITAAEIIAREISSGGPISFARFMELALYAPGAGYYASGKSRVGKGGDFFTSASVGQAFGAALACKFREIWELFGRPDEFRIIEQGANDGRLAADVLEFAGRDFGGAIRYEILEPLGSLKRIQKETLAPFAGKVFWNPGPSAAPGVFFCNELVDALPFHLLESNGSAWNELFVGMESPRAFSFVARPVSDGIAPPPPRPSGYLAEVRPAAASWIRETAARLGAGYFFVIDYGYSDPGERERPRGTFAAYRNHRRDENLLEDPGEKDLTAHVDFSALEVAARDVGLVPCGFSDQGPFLARAAEPLLRELDGQAGHKLLRGLTTLIHPGLMGASFKVATFRTPSAPVAR